MVDFKILKISHGTYFFSLEDHKFMLQHRLASVHPNTSAMGVSGTTQYENFINAKKGDVFFICRSNESVNVIGMFRDERPLHSLMKNHYEEWIDREFIVLYEPQDKNNYDKTKDKWWLPGNNSTCNEVKNNEFHLFEEKILMPAFGKNIEELEEKRSQELKKLEMSISDISKIQSVFDELSQNDLKIFEIINNLSQIEKLKIYYEYSSKGDIDKQPVVSLRKKNIQYLVESNSPLTKEKVEELKKEVANQFDKNVFQSWSSYFRILYPIYYHQYKTDVVRSIKNLINDTRKDLDIESFTKSNFVHFDGAQNQGFNRVWFAIYNSSHKNQKSAKQLFFNIYNGGYEFGLLSHKNPSINKLISSQNFDYQELLEVYRKFIPEIKEDDNTKYTEMNDLKELLEYKKQIILQGPPGTGKTYTAKDLAEFIVNDTVSINKKEQAEYISKCNQIDIIQFHPAYTYEDFIRGIITEPFGDKVIYTSKDKLFLEMVEKASRNSNPHILIIDEINRANLSSVLGELIYALEYRNESFKSMYANKQGIYEITIPENLYIIGTMNTADRSVGHLDYALRRRFAFYDILPKNFEQEEAFQSELFQLVSRLFVKEIKSSTAELEASEHLSLEFQDRPQDIWLGHSYFFKKENMDFSLQLKYEIVPILQEYVKDGILNNTEAVAQIIKDLLKYQDVNS
ncbi:ATPase family protein [Flavobacterium anhuiense]|uniref:ATPase family protein n=1 Tax=Flavobacterium anhuiense TaxID=459526 RepID=A0A444W1A6_9FLAO|nr:AAA family ATPase [Flavobacterium anhuiense]RYJ39657.1 ATPase family protein [Flavobacterium anhuiense]